MIHVQDIGIATIAISLKYDNVSREITAKKSAKKRAARSKFLFFSVIKPVTEGKGKGKGKGEGKGEGLLLQEKPRKI